MAHHDLVTSSNLDICMFHFSGSVYAIMAIIIDNICFHKLSPQWSI